VDISAAKKLKWPPAVKIATSSNQATICAKQALAVNLSTSRNWGLLTQVFAHK